MVELNSGSSVAPEVAHQVVSDGGMLIDVRRVATREEAGVINGAISVLKPDVTIRFGSGGDLEHAARDRPIVVFCTSEGGSGPVVEQLAAMGFTPVVHVSGGYPAWRGAGLDPLPESATGSWS
ncbi:rhodanese-like domain-containing protein (plasmid) [Rhodococcoides fascians]|uniref:rhodanese-like domain-containing protein n=1 Tax=Rhodococcoides fascians TaxID=1828 RepID=UPI003899A7C1